MKAITTKFLGATSTKPARIVASDSDGNRITVSATDADPHRRAAVALCAKLGWTGADTLIEGGIKGGSVFVFPSTSHAPVQGVVLPPEIQIEPTTEWQVDGKRGYFQLTNMGTGDDIVLRHEASGEVITVNPTIDDVEEVEAER